MRISGIRRGRMSGGRMTGKFGHSSSKYSKNPRVRHMRNLEGLRDTRRVRAIASPFTSVSEAISQFILSGRGSAL